MKIRFYFIAWMLCSIVGGIARIMHLNSLVSTVFLGASLILSAIFLVKLFSGFRSAKP
jgi:hypothetical protein